MKNYSELMEKKIAELGTEPLPLAPNYSPQYFEQERKKLFKRVWLCVGREEDIPKPGDFFVKELPILQTSLIVIRGKDGVVRSFHNMCKHRGNKVAYACKGSTKGFVCGFHGWTFDTEGDLVYVPEEELFTNFDKKKYGLTPVAADTWQGFIFINVDPKPKETLKQYLGEFATEVAGFPFGSMRRVAQWTADVRGNWKVFEDAFLEGYHVAFVHKRSLPDAITGKENPFCHMPPTRFFGRHRGNTALANMDHKLSPSEAIAFKWGYSAANQSGTLQAWTNALPKGVNPERSPNWAFDNFNVFPNFWIFIGGGWYFTYYFWPLEPERTLYEVNYYALPSVRASERIAQEQARVLLREALREDLSTIETTQSTQHSGAMDHMPLQRQEYMIRDHRRWIDAYVAEGM